MTIKSTTSVLATFLISAGMSMGQAPAGNDREIQFNENGSFGASPYLRWDGTNLALLSIGSTSARIFFRSENGDDSSIFSENWGPNKNRLIFHTRDDGNDDYSVFRNTHWSQGVIDVFEIHRTYTMANSNFYVVNGNMGIGTTSPNSILHIEKEVNAENTLRIRNTSSGTAACTIIRLNNDLSTSAATHALMFLNSSQRSTDGGTNTLTLRNNIGDTQIQSQGAMGLRIQANTGNVGIGTSTPDAKLTVKGTIHTQEVKVDLAGSVAPDFVFEEDYTLTGLAETETYIKTNRHLPDIPSAQQMEENGIDLKEMNLKLLQKVEELTLHLIEQDKSRTMQELKIDSLEKQLESMKSLLNELTNR